MATATVKDLTALHTFIAAIAQRLTQDGVNYDPASLAGWAGNNWEIFKGGTPDDVGGRARMYAVLVDAGKPRASTETAHAADAADAK